MRLNTLAVCAVNDYLQMMGIETNLASSDSWNPTMRLMSDVADLELSGIGRLECRVIKANEQNCYVPPEVWEDRVGYIVVQLDELGKKANLLGFVKQAIECLQLNQLQPLEDLLSYLSHLSFANTANAAQTFVNLSQWLQNIFDSSWQSVTSVLQPTESDLAFSFRKCDNSIKTDSQFPQHVRRAKLIDLGLQLVGHSIALVVELRLESEHKSGILLQVHPTGSQIYLPPLLELVVLDESGAIFLEAKARRADNYIQLQFSGTKGEKFSVKLALGEVSITENFVI